MRAVQMKKNVRKMKVTVTGIQSVEDLSYANTTAVPPLPKMIQNDSTSALAAASNPVEFIYLVQNDIPYKLRTENVSEENQNIIISFKSLCSGLSHIQSLQILISKN